jgi:hypothetical protein
MTKQARGKPSPVQAIPLMFLDSRPFFEPSVFLTSQTPWSSGQCFAAEALAEPLSSFALAIFCPHNESNNFMVADVLSRTGAIIAAGTVRDKAT